MLHLSTLSCQHTSDFDDASSSEFDSSDSGGFLGSFGSCVSFLPLAQRPFSLEGFFSAYGWLAADEEETRGEVPVNAPPVGPFGPSELPFFCFFALGLGDSTVEGRFPGALDSPGPPPPPPPPPPPLPAPPPLGDMPSIFDSFRVSLGSLKAALGRTLTSSFTLISDGFFEDNDEEEDGSRPLLLPPSLSLSPFDVALLSESFRGRSRCSLVSLCGLGPLLLPPLPSLLGSWRKNITAAL